METKMKTMDNSRIPVFEQSPVMVLILGFITCGIYYIYWYYKAAEVINAVLEREQISPMVAAFGGCCYPISIYFFYEAGKSLEEMGKKTNIPEYKDEGVVLAVISFFIPMVSAMILQSHINRLYLKR